MLIALIVNDRLRFNSDPIQSQYINILSTMIFVCVLNSIGYSNDCGSN